MSACDASEYVVADSANGETKTYCYTTACPSEHPYIADASSKNCIDRCDSGFHTRNENSDVCVDVCGAAQFAEIADADGMSECVADCGARFFEDAETADQIAYRQCVEENPARYFVREDIMINGERVTYTHYYPACPAGYPFLASTDGKECLAACASRYYSVDPGSGQKAC